VRLRQSIDRPITGPPAAPFTGRASCARAIENQVFIAACNRVGESKGEVFAGKSALIDPWGEAVVEGGAEAEALLTAEIDLAKVDDIRARIPVFKDRCAELYRIHE
jgi:predicted amidohydrolase